MPCSQRLIAYMGSALSAFLLLSACTPQSSKSPESLQQSQAQDPTTIINKLSEELASFPPTRASDDTTQLLHTQQNNITQVPAPAKSEQNPIALEPQAIQSQPVPNSGHAQPQPVPKKAKLPDKPSRTAALQQNNRSKRLTLSQLVKKYPDLLLLHGPSGSNKVALTFDDAPDTKYTPQVLDILKKYNVKATFFVVGRLVEKHPGVVKRITREGHVVGNHTFNHSLLTKLNDQQFQAQINKTQLLLKSTIGYTPKLIRPPYGEISESQLLWATNHQLTVVNWNVDSKDWKQLSQDQVTSNVLNHTKAGSIILQHSGGGPEQNLSGTVSALPTIIESLQSRGYQLVTLPELLKVPKQL